MTVCTIMKREIPYHQCLAVLIFMSASLLINIIFFKKPVYLGLITGIVTAFIISIINGYKINQIFKMMYKGVFKNIKIIFIYSMIGILIGIWKVGGIIPAILYYSFGIINKNIFLLSSFIISTIVGLLMGTSSGTVSTVGIVLVGLGHSMGFPPKAIAGAVVSGAFFGDRSSPISGMLNVVSSLTETEVNNNFIYLWRTMSFGIISASIFYAVVGLQIKGVGTGLDLAQEYKSLIIDVFEISPWLMLPPIILICFPIFKVPIVYALMIAIAFSSSFAIFHQNISFSELLKSSIFGYAPSIPKQYNTVLAGGGLLSLKTMLIVLICATALNGIFEGTKMIITIAKPLLREIKEPKSLQLFTIAFSISSAVFLCNQLMSVIVPAGVLKEKYKKMGIDNKVFALLISDSGVMVSAIIPWSVAALTPSIFMGVPVLDFIPYAFLSYTMPIITAIGVFLTTSKTNNLKLKEDLWINK